MTQPPRQSPYKLEAQGNTLCLSTGKTLEAKHTGKLWEQITSFQGKVTEFEVNAKDLEFADTAGLAFLKAATGFFQTNSCKVTIKDLNETLGKRLGQIPQEPYKSPAELQKQKTCCLPSDIGKATLICCQHIKDHIAFVGRISFEMFILLSGRIKMRWGEMLRQMEKTGANGFPIVGLVGFLTGLIIAFQSVIQLKMFGADIYASNLVAMALLRELGPLLTAIVLAGRSGSAFAAEIGTMKVNEEINALTTMGIDPIRFLVIPRFLAATIVTPILTTFAIIAGLIAGAMVIASVGYSFEIYINQIQSTASVMDYVGGLIKATVFGALVAGTGCLNGMQTGTGASAVGDSATRAVVSGIVLIIVSDGIFSVLYYHLGI